MKTLHITRKRGAFAAARAMGVYVDGAKVGQIRQNDTLTIEVPDDAKAIYGKIDWTKTEPFPIDNLADGTQMVIWAWFTFNPLRMVGIKTIPMKFDLPVDDAPDVFE